jgi:hypothetical protein
MKHALHTSSPTKAKRIWRLLGGTAVPVNGTGEMRYEHPRMARSVTLNDRRNDVPAVLLSRINQMLKMKAANDPIWDAVQ